MAKKGATVHILDIKPRVETEIPDKIPPELASLQYHQCNIASWVDLRNTFGSIGHVDIAIANAGISEEQHTSYFDDAFDDEGKLAPVKWGVLDVNYRAVLDFVKLAWSNMRQHKIEGSIVITASTSSYMPEQALPVYSSGKAAVGASNGHLNSQANI